MRAFRNAINIGLPIIEFEVKNKEEGRRALSQIKKGHILKIDFNLWDIHANYLVPRTVNSVGDKLNISYLLKKIRFRSVIQNLTSLNTRRFNVCMSVTIPDAFLIKLCTGCLYACSFCAVRLSRGRLRSNPIDQVLHEFHEGIKRGFKKFALIGTDVGAYGRDQGTDLIQLLKELLKKRVDYTLLLRNIHPRFLIDRMPEFREILKSGKISWISTAVESGNNRILKLMNRGYSVEEFKENIHLLNEDFSEIKIRTQFIVGFPSETDKEFDDTVRLLDELRFEYAEIYKFEPRPRTKAATMDNQIPEKIARKRHFKLYMKSAFNQWHRKRENLKRYKEATMM